MTAAEDVAQAVVIGEMIAEDIVASRDGTLTAIVSGREYMVEVRVLEVTGA